MKQLTPPGVWQGLFFSQKLGRRPNRPHELLAFQRYPFSVNNFVSRGLLGMRKNPKHISSGVTQWEVKKHKTHFIRCHPEASATATNTLLGNLRISFFPALSWSPLLRPSLLTPATFFPATLLSEEANMLLLMFLLMFFCSSRLFTMYSNRCLSLLWFSSVCLSFGIAQHRFRLVTRFEWAPRDTFWLRLLTKRNSGSCKLCKRQPTSVSTRIPKVTRHKVFPSDFQVF